MARRRHELTGREWWIIELLLNNKRRDLARVDDRRVLKGIVWRIRSEATWADLPECSGRIPMAQLGPWSNRRWATMYFGVRLRSAMGWRKLDLSHLASPWRTTFV